MPVRNIRSGGPEQVIGHSWAVHWGTLIVLPERLPNRKTTSLSNRRPVGGTALSWVVV